MNIDNEYTLMCKEASEIQSLRTLWEPGDVVANSHEKRLGLPIMMAEYADRSPEEIWLPRQEDLQEMVKKYSISMAELTGDFFDFTRKPYPFSDNAPLVFRLKNLSMDKIWIMFVMKKNYGKVWGGEGWVKCEC